MQYKRNRSGSAEGYITYGQRGRRGNRAVKPMAFVGIFIVLTLLFTMYQASVNEIGVGVLKRFGIDSSNIITNSVDDVALAYNNPVNSDADSGNERNGIQTSLSTINSCGTYAAISAFNGRASADGWNGNNGYQREDKTTTYVCMIYTYKISARYYNALLAGKLKLTVSGKSSTCGTANIAAKAEIKAKTFVELGYATSDANAMKYNEFTRLGDANVSSEAIRSGKDNVDTLSFYSASLEKVTLGEQEAPTANTKYIRIGVCASVTSTKDWGSTCKAQFNGVSLTLTVSNNSDNTAPTADSGWRTTNTINIADSGSGIDKYVVNNETIYPVSTYSTASTISSKQNAKICDVNSFGKYTVVVYDNLGNNATYTIYYYNPEIKTAVDESAGDGGTVSPESQTNLSPDDNYSHTVSATTNSHYFFAGWTGSDAVSASAGGSTVGTFSSKDDTNHKYTWSLTSNIPSAGKGKTSVPSNSSGTWTAKFVSISDLLSTDVMGIGASISGTTFTYTFDNLTHGADTTKLLTKIQDSVPDSIKGNFKVEVKYIRTISTESTESTEYLGKDIADMYNYDSENVNPPRYAGTYTMNIYVKYGDNLINLIGFGDYTIVINNAQVTLTPTFNTNDKIYDGTPNFTNTFNTWKVAINGTTIDTDNNDIKLQITFKDPSAENFVYDKSDAGSRTINLNLTSGKKTLNDLITFKSNGATVETQTGGQAGITEENQDKAQACIVGSCTFTYASVTGTIKPLELTISASYEDNGKTYDGTNTADKKKITITVTNAPKNITITATYGGTPVFNNPNTGTDRSIALSGIKLTTGNNASISTKNYTIGKEEYDSTKGVSYTITGLTIEAKEVTVTFTANGKVYDGTTDATINTPVIEGLIKGDEGKVTLASGYTYTFGKEDVGEQTVTLSGLKLTSTDGNEGAQNNYVLDSTPATSTANITARPVTVSIACEGKVYDGTTDATVTYDINAIAGNASSGKVEGNDLTVTGTATYDSASAGTTRVVTAKDLTLGGDDAKNYSISNETATVSGVTISKRVLSLTATTDSAGNTISTIIELYEGKNLVTDKTYTYDGKEHKPTVKVSYCILKSGDTKPSKTELGSTDVSINYGADKIINAGKYTISISTPSTSNYELAKGYDGKDIPLTASYTINQAACKILNIQEIKITKIYGQKTNASDIETTVYNAYTYVEDGENNLTVEGTWSFVGDIPTTVKRDADNKPTSYEVEIAFTPTYTTNYIAPANQKLTLTITPRPIKITAESKTSIYGNEVEALTYKTDKLEGDENSGLVGEDTFGDLTCKAVKGSKCGKYDISGDSLKNDNYEITYEGATYTITAREVTITINDNSSVYGDEIVISDTAFTVKNYATCDILDDNEKELTGDALQARLNTLFKLTIIRTEAEEGADDTKPTDKISVGTYCLKASKSTINANYTATIKSGTYTITARPVTITINNNSSVYGEEIVIDHTAFTVDNYATCDILDDNEKELTGDALQARLNTLFQLTIIRAKDKSVLATTENGVGTYYLNNSESTINANYTATIESGTYTIIARPILITPKEVRVDYGNGIYNLTYDTTKLNGSDLTGSPIVKGDYLEGKLACEATAVSPVGTYQITQGTLNNENGRNANYNITFADTAVYLEVIKLSVKVVPARVTIYYGDDLPTTFKFSTAPSELPNGETLNGELRLPNSKISGETTPSAIGGYDILPDDAMKNNNPNYDITVEGTGKFVIRKRVAVIKAESITFPYGTTFEQNSDGFYEVNATYTATDLTSEEQIKLNDAKTGISGYLVLNTTVPEDGILNVGTYGMVIGTITNSDGTTTTTISSDFYDVQLATDSGKLIITQKPITIKVTGVVEENKIYGIYGNDETFGFEVSADTPLINGKVLNEDSKLSRTNPEASGVGTYTITLGNLPTLNPNYSFALSQEYFFVIGPREITIVPTYTEVTDGNETKYVSASSVYGNRDVAIGYTVEGMGLAYKDTLTGSLSRTAGKNVGYYNVTAGTLLSANNPNYAVTYAWENSETTYYYEITRRPITVTANNVSQVFGETRLPLTYRYSSAQLVKGDALTGDVTLDDDVNYTVGVYEIKQGTLTNDNNPNYDIAYKSGKYTVTARPVTLTPPANAKKIYGETDGEFKYTATVGQGATGNAFVKGYDPSPYITLTRATGEDVGAYSFDFKYDENGKDILKNYKFTKEIQYNKFVITQAETIVSVEDVETKDDGKYYLDATYNGEPQNVKARITTGDTDVSLSYRVNGKVSDGYVHVGDYEVTVIVPTTTNYKGVSLVIYVTVKPYDLGAFDVTTIDSAKRTKVYGEADKEENFIFTQNGLGEDVVTLTLTREIGENAATYDYVDISSDNADYTVSLSETAKDAYAIAPKAVSVAPETFSKTYGELDPDLTQTVNGIEDETFDVVFTREDGSNVGTYNLIGVKSLDDNYSVTIADGAKTDTFTVTRKAVTVTATDITVDFNGSEHADELTYTAQGFLEGEAPTLQITVEGFESDARPVLAGKYNIALSYSDDFVTNDNYDVTLQNGTYTVNRAPVTVVPVAITVEYGDDIPAFALTVTGKVYDKYPLIGELGKLDVKNVGEYVIPQGTLTNENNPNYDITFGEAKLTITKRRLTVTPDQTTSQVYGEQRATIAYTVTSGSLAQGETLLGELTSQSYEFGTHAVTLGTLVENNPNYDITLGGNATFTVSKRPVNLIPDKVSSVYGEPHVALTYTVTSDLGEGLVNGDVLDGELQCNIGAHVGEYDITLGTVSGANYDITFVNAKYTVAPRPVTVTLNAQSSEYGQDVVVNQNAYEITEGSVLAGDTLDISINKAPGSAMGEYALTAICDNKDYDVTFVNGIYTVKKYRATITVANSSVTKVYDGTFYAIVAECSSGATIICRIDGNVVPNTFTDAGKYYVELTANETKEYYAPESVFVTITIRRDVIVTEDSGIDVVVENDSGFDPDVKIGMKKLPQNDENMSSLLSSNQKIVGAFSIGTVGDELTALDGNNTLKIKVPTSLKGNETVKVIVSDENNVCTMGVYEVTDGYITIETTGLTGFAFVEETTIGLGVLYYVLGGVGLITIIALIVFMFRKRA